MCPPNILLWLALFGGLFVGCAAPEETVRRLGRVPATITNTIGMRLVPIPPGEMMMGADEKDPDTEEDERPLHRVRITRPFFLGACEVTLGDFREFVRSTGYQTSAEIDGEGSSGYNAATNTFEYERAEYTWRNTGWDRCDSHPVVNVTWQDAVAFCAWLGRKEGRRYRLPTEAEWEYACRAGTKTRFAGGDTLESVRSCGNVLDESLAGLNPRFGNVDEPAPLARVNWWNDSHPFTARVGEFAPNAFGLYDMHGNVWEWCTDWYDEDAYERSSTDDPTGPAAGAERVIRSGSFLNNPRLSRSASRHYSSPAYRNYIIGFRVLVEVEPDSTGDEATGDAVWPLPPFPYRPPAGRRTSHSS